VKFSGDAAILAFFHIAYCLTLPGESLRLNRFDAISAIFGAPEKEKYFAAPLVFCRRVMMRILRVERIPHVTHRGNHLFVLRTEL
jgi:hypothetical protein